MVNYFLLLDYLFIHLFNYLLIATLYHQQEYTKYTCKNVGHFPHPESSDCRAFLLCDNKLKATTQICPAGTYYWPSEDICASYYNCSTASSPDGTNPCKLFPSMNILNKFATGCSSYINCNSLHVPNSDNSYWYDGTYGMVQNCPSGEMFQQYRRECVANTKCTNYKCVAEGYFPNPDSSDCSSFIICDKFTLGYNDHSLLYPTLVACPPNTSFSPFSKKCDAYYTCGGKDIWKGIYPCSTYNWASPIVPNPADTKCTTYLSCLYSSPDYPYNRKIKVIEKKVCPTKTFFSPILGKCYYNYECNETCSKDPCGNGIGKFADYKSGYCEGFIECRDDSTDTNLYRPTYEKRYCPPGTNFSPKIADCDRDYVCPKISVNYCYPTIATTAPPTPAPE